jgi:hypothetical protein
MSERGKELFGQLQTPESIRGLIGQSEDAHFDCKEWPASDGDAQKVFAKAACGLTNAEGGVVVVGMKARAITKDEPDLVDSAAPVIDTRAVKSRILDLIGQLVEPGIEAVQASEINEPAGSRSGFVVVYIPASEGSPRRSRKDWKFYLRIGSGTFPMEYFQIEERFGKRPPPKLGLYLELEGIRGSTYDPRVPERTFVLGLRNLGAGIAKFPSIRYRRLSGLGVSQFGIDGNMGFGLPQRPSDNEWASFRGGVDEVIYPGETRKITRLVQLGQNTGVDPQPQIALGPFGASGKTQWIFRASEFQCEISCEGIPTMLVEKPLIEDSVIWPQ